MVLMSAWVYLVSDSRFIPGITSCRAPYNATPTGLERSLVMFCLTAYKYSKPFYLESKADQSHIGPSEETDKSDQKRNVLTLVG
jgi:hypothetical protein